MIQLLLIELSQDKVLLLIFVIVFEKWKYKYSKTDNISYANGNAIQPNNLFGISLLYIVFIMALYSFRNKKLEDFENVYQASLMYKLLSDNEEDMMIVIQIRIDKCY